MKRVAAAAAAILASALVVQADTAYTLRKGAPGVKSGAANGAPVWNVLMNELGWTVGVPVATVLSATDPENGPLTYALAPGSPALPAGVTLNANGTFSGSPSAAGSSSFTVRATDNGGLTADQAYLQTSAYASSCLALFNAGVVTDGARTIDPDGIGPISPISLYCDMTTDGGGWTLVRKSNNADGGVNTDSGYNTGVLTTATVNATGILPAATINAIGTTFRQSSSTNPGQTFFWQGAPFHVTPTGYSSPYAQACSPAPKASLTWNGGPANWSTGGCVHSWSASDGGLHVQLTLVSGTLTQHMNTLTTGHCPSGGIYFGYFYNGYDGCHTGTNWVR